MNFRVFTFNIYSLALALKSTNTKTKVSFHLFIHSLTQPNVLTTAFPLKQLIKTRALYNSFFLTQRFTALICKLTRVFLYILANCPAGSYYSSENNTCVKCPLGTYQPAQGQTKCISCGKNLITALSGTVEESDCIGNVYL